MRHAEDKVLAAFSVDHAARITGLSKARLTRWDKLGFFAPEYVGDDDRSNPYARVYSYTDLVGLRTLKILADEYRVPLAELRKAARELAKRSDRPWSEIPLAVLKRKVIFDLDTQPLNADGEYALKHIPLGPIERAVKRGTEQLRHRDNSQIGRFESRRFVVHNAEVIAGTRIPIATVASFIDAGYSDQAILDEYPTLTRADIAAVRQLRQSAA